MIKFLPSIYYIFLNLQAAAGLKFSTNLCKSFQVFFFSNCFTRKVFTKGENIKITSPIQHAKEQEVNRAFLPSYCMRVKNTNIVFFCLATREVYISNRLPCCAKKIIFWTKLGISWKCLTLLSKWNVRKSRNRRTIPAKKVEIGLDFKIRAIFFW